MPTNPQYPSNIYLQGNLRLTEKRTVRQDARINNRGNGQNPGPTQRPNNSIPLKEWIQEQIDNELLNIPCTCEETKPSCTIKATNDAFKFSDNSLAYQFLDVAHNDIFRSASLSNINIVIVDDTQLSEILSVSVFNSPFYAYPIIKLVKPDTTEEVGNIDTPETFTYKITALCGNVQMQSNIATVTLLPVSVNLEEYINNNES